MRFICRGDLEVFSRVRKIKKNLRTIVNSCYPSNVNLWKSHENLVIQALKYLHELYAVDALMADDLEVVMASRDIFFKIIKEADWIHVEHWGHFCKIVLIENPDGKYWLIHLASSTRLKGIKR